MLENIMDSYLVRLQSAVDTTSFTKFNQTLADSAKQFSTFSIGSVEAFAKLDIAVAGAFASMGVGLISLGDKFAQADQQTRLFGMRMGIGAADARALTWSLNDLGVTMDEAFDSEVNQRLTRMISQYKELGETLPKNYELNMKSFRAMGAQVSYLERGLEVLTMGTLSRFFDKLEGGSGKSLNKLDQLGDWMATNIPKWEDEISTGLVPIWNDAVVVVEDFGSMLKTAAGDFSFLSGVLLGDDSIKTTEFSIKNAMKATQDWADVLTELGLMLQFDFRVAAHFVTALSEGWAAASAFRRGDFDANASLFADARKEFTAGTDDITDGLRAPNWIAAAKYDPDFAGLAAHLTDLRNRGKDDASSSNATASPEALDNFLRLAGTRYNVDPNLLAAIIHRESNGDPTQISARGAKGLMQLMPDTAKQYGVSNPFDPAQNVDAGAAFLAQLSKHYRGNAFETIGAYNWGQGNMDSYIKTGHGFFTAKNPTGELPSETRDYVRNVLRDYGQYSAAASQPSVNITGPITINVPAGTHPDAMKGVIADGMRDFAANQNRRVMAQTAGGPH